MGNNVILLTEEQLTNLPVEELIKKVEECNKEITAINNKTAKDIGRKEEIEKQIHKGINEYKEKYGVELDINNNEAVQAEYDSVRKSTAENVARMQQILSLVESGRYTEVNHLLGIEVKKEAPKTKLSSRSKSAFTIEEVTKTVEDVKSANNEFTVIGTETGKFDIPDDISDEDEIPTDDEDGFVVGYTNAERNDSEEETEDTEQEEEYEETEQVDNHSTEEAEQEKTEDSGDFVFDFSFDDNTDNTSATSSNTSNANIPNFGQLVQGTRFQKQ